MTATQAQASDPTLTLRHPRVADAAGLWRLVADSGKLDVNSPYAYLMWCDHFSQTSIVAELGAELVGFVTGFHPPKRPTAFFVWQVAVTERARGRGLARRMITKLLEATDARFLEATVTPSNGPSSALFRSFARHYACPCEELPHYQADDFPSADGAVHEAEILFRIGPFEPQAKDRS